MTKFQYTALTEDGQRVAGTLEADTEGAVLRLLEERQLFPLSVADTGKARSIKRIRREESDI